MKRAFPLALFAVLPLCLAAGEKRVQPQDGRTAPGIVRAIRTDQAISIDGSLREKAWQTPAQSDFVMSEPEDGGRPTEKTDVWVAYDDENLYVAASLHESDPKGITGLLGRRDEELDSDWFFFAVDPYFDRRSGFQFAVNPSGSIRDMALSNDVDNDDTWDGIWEAQARINGDGWIVEMRIPLNQLRFPQKAEYVWGVDFRRVIKRNNERVGYVWVPRDQSAYVSRFARLEGIADIKPGRRLEVFPYTVGQAQFKPAEAGNPFERGHAYAGNAGFDLKAGLRSNLTLDATINPDFGQVEVDPAVINLSAYETYYDEKRPFFIEGASLFNGFGRGGIHINANLNWPNPRFFYSRRIGRSPQGDVTHEGFVDYPDRSKIIGAFKLTGKPSQGLGVGFINAFTARGYADVDSFGTRFRDEVQPFSWYGVLRIQKDIGQGQSGYGVMATGVVRDLRNESLRDVYAQNALSLAFDGWTFLDKSRTWVVGGWMGGTRIEGSRENILRLQRSSMHYFQRPDASHVRVNPEATALSGWGTRLNMAKQQGKFLFLASLGALSPGFNPNDVGFQSSGSDKINLHILPGYQWTKPGKVLRNALWIAGPFWNFDFDGNKIWEGYLTSIEGEFANYWGFGLMLAYNPETISNNLTRGGPLIKLPSGYQVDLNLSSDSRKAVVLEWASSQYWRPSEGRDSSIGFTLRWKPRSNISVSLGPQYARSLGELQWVTRVEDPLQTRTFGARYIFGRIDQTVVSSEIRLNWIFTPRLSLQTYLQPYIAVGSYDKLKEIATPGEYAFRIYGDAPSTISRSEEDTTVDPDGAGPAPPFSFPNPDFNMKSLRGTIVLRWEYRPGSLVYLVWTQNRADDADPGDFRLRRDIRSLLRTAGDNIFLFKVSYRWNM